MPRSKDPFIGREIDGRYRVIEVIGRGGMGAVYRARQLGIDRDVALKVLRADKRNDAALKRFEAEARIIARLRHPHTVRLIDFGHVDDDLYLVLELIGGHSLKERIADDSLPRPLVLELCAEIADALTEAHRAGIVHRDLKPGNIIVEQVGDREVARILDFGVAYVSDSTMTRTGAVVGTPAYLSPEQARSETVTAAADLYALGVILYEALSGMRPFRASSSYLLMMKHISETPRPLGPMLPPEAPWPEVAELVEQLLAKAPADRPSSAGDVRDRLRVLRAQVPDTTTETLLPPDDDSMFDSSVDERFDASPANVASGLAQSGSATAPAPAPAQAILPTGEPAPAASPAGAGPTEDDAPTPSERGPVADRGAGVPGSARSPADTAAQPALPMGHTPIILIAAIGLVLGVAAAWLAIRADVQPTEAPPAATSTPPATAPPAGQPPAATPARPPAPASPVEPADPTPAREAAEPEPPPPDAEVRRGRITL